ncbi:MAG: hypothetical protein H0V44_01635 [Planctomycetes bacterium]|nr:hypothetical protein [Planctomycetota bacterium]
MRILLLIIACLAAHGLCAADLPDDAAKAVAAYDKKKLDSDAKVLADIAKEKEALAKNMQKVLEEETKAHHSDAVRRINGYLEDAERKSTADLPEEAAECIGSFEKKKRDIEAKADGEIAKQKESLVKVLRKAFDRETKAGHTDVAAALKQTLEVHGDKAPAAGETPIAAATPGKNPPWPEFLKSLKVISIGGWEDTKPTAITIGDYTKPCPYGLNVVAMVEGKRVIEKTCHSEPEYQALFDEFEKLPNGAYLVATIRQDTGCIPFSTKGQKVLRACGAKQGLDGAEKLSAYVLIGAKGMTSAQAIERIQPGRIEYPFPAAAKK